MSQHNFESILLNSCSSTMDEAKSFSKKKKHDQILCILARQQISGRGRGGSTWVQSYSQTENILAEKSFHKLSEVFTEESNFLPLTLVIPMAIVKVPFEWISMIVGCSLFDALKKTDEHYNNLFVHSKEKEKNHEFFIKWPNDIVTFPEYKKIAGILCESSVLNGKVEEVFVGIGLNFFSHPQLENSASFFSEKISSSINEEDKKNILQYFAKEFCCELEEYLFYSRTVHQLKHLASERLLPKGTFLSVNKGAVKGKFVDIALNGALILEGVTDPIYSGDISVEPQNFIENKIVPVLNLKKKELVKSVLAVDFGNTRIHIACKNSDNVLKYSDIKYNYDGNLKEELKEVIENLFCDQEAEVQFIYTSVIKSLETEKTIIKLFSLFKKIYPKILFNRRQLTEDDIFKKTKIKGDFEQNKIGSDRALKFYFSYFESMKLKINTLVFSFGTAMTCEGVSADGSILENFVLPGLQMSFNALHNETALLPALKPNSRLFSPEGKHWNQEIYLQRGIFMSVVGSILATVQLHQPCQCYFNGGNAQQVSDVIDELIDNIKVPSKYKIIPHLETKMILEFASFNNFSSENSSFLKKIIRDKKLKAQDGLLKIGDKKTQGIEETETKQTPFQVLLNSVIKSRVRSKESRNAPIKLEDFRKIGPRIENSNEERLDLYMSQRFKFHTREEWRDRILNSEVMIEFNSPQEFNHARKPNLSEVKPTYKIKNFDQIWLFHPPEYEPEFLDHIDVLYDNKDICIFNKPPNLVVHAAGLYLKNTFVEHISKMGYTQCSPVHRIDRETSGLLICARLSETRKILSDAFRKSQVRKLYLAVTKGTALLPNEFSVNYPIGEPENSLIRLKLWIEGKNLQPACTQFVKLSTVDDYSLWACLPVTGRTNQIRIHLAAIGHWIVGDKMYHENENVFIEFYEKGFTQWVHEQVIFPRHLLHNTGIIFNSCLNIEPLSFAPQMCPLPDDMSDFNVVQKLMQEANISLEKEEQTEKLKEIFLDIMKIDFTQKDFFP